MQSHQADQASRSSRNPAQDAASRPSQSGSNGALQSLQQRVGNHAFGQFVVALRRVPSDRGAGKRATAVQRVFLKSGTRVTEDPFSHTVPGTNPEVKVVSYTSRHTIKGFVQEGTTKAINTLLLKKVEMTAVSTDAYAAAWNPTAGRLNVKDGTTFVSAGITWGVNAMPSDNSIHIWPVSGSADTIDISGNEKGPLGTYLSWRSRNKTHAESAEFALGLVQKKSGDKEKFNKCVAALIAMTEVAP
jgi:hypothetical protein